MATSETCVPISRPVAEGLAQYLHALPQRLGDVRVPVYGEKGTDLFL